MKTTNSRSYAAKLHRAALKNDPIRAGQFGELVRANMKRIWEERHKSGKLTAISEKIGKL